jgi:hypothetical protein
MGQTHSVDDLLVKVSNEQTGIDNGEPSIAPVEQPEVDSGAMEQPEVAAQADEPVPEGHDAELSEAPKEEAHAEDDEPASDSVASPIDEYGNPVEKPRTYTEEEVQRMIRDRLSRGKHAEQPTQQQVQKDVEGFKADPASEDAWEVQLEQFIEKTIEKRQQKQTEAQWRQQQAQKQAEFETKFTSGMGKYQDFHQVVAGKPITDAMMMATRGMENPAAFIYAACKMKPSEINRIAAIIDPTEQMVEIGRLDAEMRKEHARVSAAPKPVQAVKGDMPVKQHNMPSIDARIHQYAKQKVARKY